MFRRTMRFGSVVIASLLVFAVMMTVGCEREVGPTQPTTEDKAAVFESAGYDGPRLEYVAGELIVKFAAGASAAMVAFASTNGAVFSDALISGLERGLSLYGSIGQAAREPGRSDLFQGEDNPTIAYDLRAVKPERVVNVETGVSLMRPGLSLLANAYFMEFHDEIAQTGELSETFLPLRRNVARSHRRGLELDLRWEAMRSLRIGFRL
jgi:hypothetical protein